MKSLLKLQEHALDVGSKFVKPGGYLVYSTCTLNPEENEKQIDKFLNSNKDFRIINATEFIPSQYTKGDFLYTFPIRDKADGTFAAKLRKEKKQV